MMRLTDERLDEIDLGLLPTIEERRALVAEVRESRAGGSRYTCGDHGEKSRP